jgi:hypothetical protein
MKKILLAILLGISATMLANKVTFKLVNASTLLPIEGVSMKSSLDTSLHLRSDKYGHITFSLRDKDTLIFIKDFYHPIYIFAKAKNFDSTHVISINMIPSKDIHEPLKGNFQSLSDFNYHFVHDEAKSNSQLKISAYEHVDAAQVRKLSTDSLNHNSRIYVVPNLHLYKGKSQYKLK